MANLKDLIVNGASRFIGKVYINDSSIGVINGSTVGDYPKFTDNDTTYAAVGTSGNAGLMSTADKVKLNSIAASATRNTFSAFTGAPTSNQTPGFGSTFNIYQVGQTTAGAITTTARTVKIPDTDATTAAHGLLTAADKIKLNALTTADATTSAHGYLTAADKIKLNALSTVDNNTTYGLVTTAANGLAPKLSNSASQYLNGLGSWTTPTNTTYADATTSTHGLMTAVDKIKLNALSTVDNDTTYALATTAANGLMSSTDKQNLNSAYAHAVTNKGTSAAAGLYKIKTNAEGHITGTTAVAKADITALGIPGTDTNTTYAAATTSAAGLMSADDKKKLESIASSATRNTFSAFTGAPTSNQTPGFGSTFNIYQVGQTTAGAITTTARTVKIPNTAATTAAAGLMSAADKIKLNNCSTGSSLQYVADGTSQSVLLGNVANNVASGQYSVAEGNATTAFGEGSHAEGCYTYAYPYSHAQGYQTQAGYYSHAEGNNTAAIGWVAHAEGMCTTALGNYSHTEGNGTIAQCKSQHVFGEYNIVDPSTGESERGQYVEIVGNGYVDEEESVEVRRNARTLDWYGNETLSGGLICWSLYGKNLTILRPEASSTNFSTVDMMGGFNTRVYSTTGENKTVLELCNISTVDNTPKVYASISPIYVSPSETKNALAFFDSNYNGTAWYGERGGYIDSGVNNIKGYIVHGANVNNKMTLSCDTNSKYVAFYADGSALGAIYVGGSDSRVKKDIEPLSDKYKKAISKVEFKDFHYDFKDNTLSKSNNYLRFGVIAQDIIAALKEENIPEQESELIDTLKDEINGERYIVNYTSFLVTRLAADEDRIKQLEETVKNLTTRLEALEYK